MRGENILHIRAEHIREDLVVCIICNDRQETINKTIIVIINFIYASKRDTL